MIFKIVKKFCYARCFDLLRNSPLSSIHIHFGVELLALAALLTSVSLSKTEFFDKLRLRCKAMQRSLRLYSTNFHTKSPVLRTAWV